MQTLVFALHCALVFGVPTLFGWVLLRRVFREASLVALIPGSMIAGLAALMALVNELRFIFEMGTSVWFAYKLLLALALLLVVTVPARSPRPGLPGCARRPWQLALIAVGTSGVALFYGIPAYGGYLNDAWWFHYPAVVQIQNVERFPLNHVFALDNPLYYHHGPDILAAIWSFLLDIPVQKAWVVYVTLLAPCTFLLAFALLARLSRNFWSALLGATFLIGGGNLRFLFFLTESPSGPLGALQVLNSQTVQGLLQLMFTPSHALGIPIVLLVLLLFRHVSTRLGWLNTAVLGLLLATLTLVAEWYFLPLTAGLTLVLLARWWPRRRQSSGRPSLLLAVLPAVIVFFWGSFNNTYLSGVFGHFWMRNDSIEVLSQARQLEAKWSVASAKHIGGQELGGFFEKSLNSGDPTYRLVFKPALPPAFYQPKWSVPNLVPLRLNFSHFGWVPSWEAAGSNDDSFVPIFSARFLLEAAPVLLLGIPFGLLLAWRRRQPVVLVLSWLAFTCALPPVFLDWGYRSTDFLRFFTAAYCFSALFTGWLAGAIISRPGLRSRMLGSILTLSCLVAPAGLGILGLMPGTIDKINAISAGAKSLSAAAAAEQGPVPATPAGEDIAARSRAFEKLAVRLGDYLFPLTKGRDRAIVIVPPDQLPKLRYFPEWMKIATLSRLLLPVGWHWEDSAYSAYYLDAVTRLDAVSVASLEARWIVLSDVFQKEVPAAVAEALVDRTRFIPVAQFGESGYHVIVYRVLP